MSRIACLCGQAPPPAFLGFLSRQATPGRMSATQACNHSGDTRLRDGLRSFDRGLPKPLGYPAARLLRGYPHKSPMTPKRNGCDVTRICAAAQAFHGALISCRSDGSGNSFAAFPRARQHVPRIAACLTNDRRSRVVYSSYPVWIEYASCGLHPHPESNPGQSACAIPRDFPPAFALPCPTDSFQPPGNPCRCA
jgi:hypothetical protein